MIIIYFLVFIWSIRILFNVLSFIHLWYVKEYRMDRMLIHLRTKQGKRLLFLPLKLPPLTPKTVVLFCTLLVSLVAIFMYVPFPYLVRMLFLDIVLFPLTILFVVATTIPTYVYHAFVIRRAVVKFRAHRPMKIIGITGSYGKTSTKEILSTLLGSKYKTLKTKASKNSPIGIAETILSDLQPDHEAFVVEMGAYRPGEIRKMCEMVRPQIGIITAINAQHQDLFGTIETTMKAKYELVQGLVGDKIALFNRDNSHVYQMSQWAKKDHVRVHYFSTQDNTTDVGYRAGNIMSSEKGISFTLSINNQKKSVTAPLIGIHQASNIVAAAGAASVCGLTLAEIVSACRFIVPFEKTMKIIHGPTGATYIDDTFNNNPDAAIAAITYLKSTKRKKILVFQPMIELGNFTDESHKRVGAFAARVCDEIILTNDNYFEPFKEGVVSAAPTCSLHVLETSAAISHLKKILSSGDTVLFKGKEAAHVLSGLLQS